MLLFGSSNPTSLDCSPLESSCQVTSANIADRLEQAGKTWLEQQVPKILRSPAFTRQHSLLVVVWDEGNALSNNVVVIFAGPDARNGYLSHRYYSHYSLLHTIEWLWGIKPLTRNDASAPIMNDMLRGF
jgi:hypothetical protein